MLKTELKRGVLFTVVTMMLLGFGYHLVLWGFGRAFFPVQGRRQPDPPQRRHNSRLSADRAEVYARRILPARVRRPLITTPLRREAAITVLRIRIISRRYSERLRR